MLYTYPYSGSYLCYYTTNTNVPTSTSSSVTLTQSFKNIIFLYIQVGHGLHHAMVESLVESQIDHINRACK